MYKPKRLYVAQHKGLLLEKTLRDNLPACKAALAQQAKELRDIEHLPTFPSQMVVLGYEIREYSFCGSCL